MNHFQIIFFPTNIRMPKQQNNNKSFTNLVRALNSETISVRVSANRLPFKTGTSSHLSDENKIFNAVPIPVV